MAQQLADQRDVEFVLHEQMQAENLQKYPGYEEFNKKTINMLVKEGRNFSIKEILANQAESDRVGAVFNQGEVIVPECLKRPYSLLCENGWAGMTASPEYGGQGLPNLVAQAVNDYLLAGGGMAVTGLNFLAQSAAEMIELFGTDEQKKLFIEKMYTGEWGGTMVLTEPEAGSDVGNLSTSAVKNPDGTYSITGNKIFISGGEQDITENIIHMVLARVEGAPKGTKGISIFIVPKYHVNEDGSLGALNDVACTGIEEKMGLHSSATCSMSFGSKGECKGVLLGEENMGMKIMFHMMNEARLFVGTLGLTGASQAYLLALEYARERHQGRELENTGNPDAPPVPIIRHPDVRRMLLWMKAHVEGMRSLVYFGALCVDKSHKADTEEKKAQSKGMLDLLTPIIKTYCAEKGVAVCNEALQVFGGYGFTKEYLAEQLLRDSRIGPIYEGTTGIQAMDLLGRKLGMNDGRNFVQYTEEIRKTAALAAKTPGLESLAEKMEAAVVKLEKTAMHIGGIATSLQFKTAFAHSTPFLLAMGDVTMAWMLLWRAAIAQEELSRLVGDLPEDQKQAKIEKSKPAAFYAGQVHSATYFIEAVIPETLGKMDAIENSCSAALDISEVSFGS